jgi:hypothetical protein
MGPGLTIEGATLPVTLLSDHCGQDLLVVAQTAAATAQSMAIEFQLTRANQNRKNVHAGLKLTHGQGQSKT